VAARSAAHVLAVHAVRRLPKSGKPVSDGRALNVPSSAAAPRVSSGPVRGVKHLALSGSGYGRTDAAAPVAAFVPATAVKTEKRVSLDFVGADINDVLKALALQANVNIVTAADVKGNITVSLQRVTVPEALDMVARLSGFHYAAYGPAYVVGTEKSVAELIKGTTEAPAAQPLVTAFLPYRFLAAGDLSKALESRFPGMKTYGGASGGAASGTDDKSAGGGVANTVRPSQARVLAVTDTVGRVEEAREFVRALDEAAQFPAQGSLTEVYRIKYAASRDLASILSQLVPTVQVLAGPSQGFVSGSSGASASYAAGPGEGSGANAGSNSSPTASGATGGGTSSPAAALASGSAPTTLLLTGPAEDNARARQVLDQVDVRAPQMTFEAKVVDVNNSDFSQIGLSYDFNNGGSGIRLGEADTASPSIQAGGARKPNFGAIFRTPYSIGVNLDLLARNGRARVLANPNISALDGQPAVVFIGDQIKYVIRQEVTPTGTNIQTETATVGITLKVTGKSSPDGTITLYVHPEVSTVSSFLSLSSGISLPQIATRFVDTTIRVKNGETIAIGGLVRETDITNIQKVPFLGDLPFFGQLFKRTEKNKSRSEIVIFITSRLLAD
jgi:type II secretory pathway component GspD/PulD (secretin)